MSHGLIKKCSSYILSIIFIMMIALSISKSFLWLKSSNKTNSIMDSITKKEYKEEVIATNQELFNPPNDKNDSYWDYQNIPFLQVDFNELLQDNDDTVGWIQVIGTNIDYPIVQAKDNEFYLDHSFDKSYNQAGWIFSDFRNNLDNLNHNTIIYGHARLDNTMFGSLKDILNDNWFHEKDNHIIKVSTPMHNMIFQIFSVYVIPKESYYITSAFHSDTAFLEFLNTITDRSIIDFSTTTNIRDRILTLSTCKDNLGNRLVLHAKLIKKETRS